MPLINVVIPTCDRAETLQWSLKTCLNQSYPNYKIWVIDNSSLDNTEEVARGFNDKRINYIKNPVRSAMTTNWEFALSHITAGYVMFIGDDDGLVPDSLKYLARLIDRTDSPAIKLFPSTYFWPDIGATFREFHSNLLSVYKENYFKIINSSEILNETVTSLDIYPSSWIMPSIYHGIVSVDLVKSIMDRDGAFFNSPIPDVYASVIIAAEIKNYILTFAPVCINGTSKFSTGVALSSAHKNKISEKSRKNFYQQEKSLFHPMLESEELRLAIYPNAIIMAECFLKARENNKLVPAINLETVLRKVIDYDLYHTSSPEHHQAILESVSNVGKINNLEAFIEELLKNQSGQPPAEHQFKKENFEIIPTPGAKNVFDASLLISGKADRNHLYKPFGHEFNRSNSSELYQYIYNQLSGRFDTGFFKEELHTFLPEKDQVDKSPPVIELLFKTAWDPQTTISSAGYLIMSRLLPDTVLTHEQVDSINLLADQIWVPSEIVKENYRQSGIDQDKIKTLPAGVDTDLFNPSAKPLLLETGKKFKFLFHGSLNDDSGIYLLIQAFLEEFPADADNDVCLLISDDLSSNLEISESVRTTIATLSKNTAPEIILLNEPIVNLAGIYAASDCFVYPFSRDLNGLHILEAMACSVPVITTKAHSALDFCDNENAYLVNCLTDKGLITIPGSLDWPGIYPVKPDKQHLKQLMREVFNNKRQAEIKATKASQAIIENYSKKRISEQIAVLLDKLKLQPVSRFNLYYQAQGKIKQEKYGEAIIDLTRLIKLNVLNYDICYLLAQCLEKADDHKTAAAYYQKARELS